MIPDRRKKGRRAKAKDAEAVKVRAYAPAPNLSRRWLTCAIPGCGRPTTRAQGRGLAVCHCKYHVQFKSRHGSHWRKSYRATELRPYLKAAQSWIRRNREDFYVAHALRSLEVALQSAGEAVIAPRLQGRSAEERAKIALARLREKEVPPERLLAAFLAVVMIIEEDLTSHRVPEFLIVQIAKAVHRLASGHHRRWDIPTRHGGTVPYEMHKYPRSAGLVLRHLGRMIEACCEWVEVKHLPAILALKVERYGRHPTVAHPRQAPIKLPGRPYPETGRPGGRPRTVSVVKVGGRTVKRVITYD